MAKFGHATIVTGLIFLFLTLSASRADDSYSSDMDYDENKDYDHPSYEEHAYAYYLNHKLYHAFSHYFKPAVYPFLQCIEPLDANTYEPYDYDNKEAGYDDKYKIMWRAHFGYYSSYYKPYKVCERCSHGISFDSKKRDFDHTKGPTEFVSGYSTHFPNSAFHVDFEDGKDNYASWQINHLSAIATTKAQRCPTYKYSRMVYGKSPDIDVKYLKFAYSLKGPWVDNHTYDSYGGYGNAKRDSGYTYFGQFIDHDITKDSVPGSEMDEMYSSDSKNYIRKPDFYKWDPQWIKNGRTPLLDLDSVYGKYGREWQYRDEEDSDKLREGDGNDVYRNKDATAMIPEARNDENVVVSQFEYAFIDFHNEVVDWIRERDYKQGCKESIAVFERAKKYVIWHYQWIVLNVFLPTLCDHDILDHIHQYGRRHFVGQAASKLHIPIEFAAAGYRMHSIVRSGYKINNDIGFKKLFDASDMNGLNDMRGGKFMKKNHFEIDWRLFLTWKDENVKALPGRLIDENVSPSLLNLPIPPAHGWIVDHTPISLPMRSILRGAIYGIPSGEDVAKAFHVRRLSPYQVDWYVKGYYRPDGKYDEPRTDSNKKYQDDYDDYDYYENYDGTPLWYYLQREAMVHNDGERLGYVGSLIVAETLIGLLQHDPDSFLNAAPGFKPFLYSENSWNGRRCEEGYDCVYKIQDLLDFADLRKPKKE